MGTLAADRLISDADSFQIPAYTGCGFETECAAARQTNTMNFRRLHAGD